MSIDGTTGLDHLVIATRDLDAARDAYVRLGFTVTPRGHHTELKSANHTVMFADGTYLELLGIEEQRPANAHYSAFLRERQGIAAIALKTADAHAAREPLAAAGFPTEPPVDFGRPVETPEGNRDARFTITQIDPATTPGGRVFLCRHHTPDLVWRKDSLNHPNGATGLEALVIAADDPAAVAATYARLLGGSVSQHGAALLVEPSGGEQVRLLVATPDRLHWAWTSDPAFAAPLPFFAGFVVRVADLEKTQQTLQKSKFPTVVGGGVLRVGSASACGAMVAFARDFDLNALIP
ncbi:VOC family protein [Azospirillum picis]|uniref:Catechol 2,3-dioxygenase-like lactoylglutathione lyase family enzyme n=1 Tax=Azospirillum picis TaxID=488438 RepID=A0ABU0MTM5_9PROT|nr:VOC family protein [Azospirillum picis]MBP2303095.1 catechol 2,3-dioxygenase-like lactoylglutathione lyase family enzyme [Azospirillum picis]MDQ0536847.1 catechol 2,3-dioxygenase-like lactoylglutathione lyase family enzyme [Azospirillum picis]